jgi:ubiquinone biosynthesis monooxygenase Coq7
MPSTNASGRRYGPLDRLIIGLDQALGRATRPAQGSGRPYPGAGLGEPVLEENERSHAEALLRVDHAGEIAAQALYHAQALVARQGAVRDAMQRAAEEEIDHLAWCERRLAELGGRTSLLGPFWYAGSFAIGAVAGLCGDRWSLGFVAETERQVVRHLEDHLERLPAGDLKSRAIVARMRDDESRHATAAVESGGAALPGAVRDLMQLCSRVMTGTAYWL